MTSQSWPSSSLESQGPRPKARFNSCQETVQPLYATRMISQGSFTVEGSSHVNCLREIPANLQPMNTNMLLWMLSHHISGKILSQFFTDPEAMPVGCGWFLIFFWIKPLESSKTGMESPPEVSGLWWREVRPAFPSSRRRRRRVMTTLWAQTMQQYTNILFY